VETPELGVDTKILESTFLENIKNYNVSSNNNEEFKIKKCNQNIKKSPLCLFYL
jgi:hypothetical protein